MGGTCGSVRPVRVGVLVSGSGTNLQALIDARIPVVVVLSDRPDVPALERAEAAGIATEVIDRSRYLPDRREELTHAVVDALRAHEVELVAMAGFMTILCKPMFDTYEGMVVNTHPSLLPAFRGAHAVEEALEAGVKVTGCTIHIATAEVDDGPILAQEPVPVEPDDTVDSLHERIKGVEHRLYPETLQQFIERVGSGGEEEAG